jgi:tetratricopeptide (TPR) repeat protein
MQLTDSGYLPAKVGYERGRALELEALKHDPNLSEAHGGLAYIHQVYDWDWEAATAEVLAALRANPINEHALRVYGQIALTLGKADEAVRYLDASLSRNPLDTYALWARGHALYISSRYAESEQTYRRLLEIEPQFSWAHSYLAKTLIAAGRPGDALVVAQQEPEEENRLDILAIAFDSAGRRQEADTALDTLIKKYGASDAYYVAMTYANRGDNDRAIEWLNRAYSQRDSALWEITHEPLFKSVAHDSRFKAFLRKMNLPE